MAKFTNVSGEDRDIPAHNLLVLAGEDFEVPDEDADGLRSQPWCQEKTTSKKTVTVPVDAEQGVN